MTEADLNRIASTLALALPAFYRRYMLNYPCSLAEEQPEWSDVRQWELADDPDRVIHFNRYVRDCEPGEFFDDRSWPPHYFVIGSEQEQNWYFLDLAKESETVYCSSLTDMNRRPFKDFKAGVRVSPILVSLARYDICNMGTCVIMKHKNPITWLSRTFRLNCTS